MTQHAIHALPVISGVAGNLVGIITTTDIIAAALNQSHGLGSSEPSVDGAAGNASTREGSASANVEARLKLLTDVLNCARRFLSAGQDERLHSALLRAIDAAVNDDGMHALPLRL